MHDEHKRIFNSEQQWHHVDYVQKVLMSQRSKEKPYKDGTPEQVRNNTAFHLSLAKLYQPSFVIFLELFINLNVFFDKTSNCDVTNRF